MPYKKYFEENFDKSTHSLCKLKIWILIIIKEIVHLIMLMIKIKFPHLFH